MLLYITRHGETEWNLGRKTQGITNTKLTEKGKRQAELLAQRLKDESIQRIFCSDLDRAFETAGIVGDRLGLNPVPTPLLREVCFGSWEGHTLEEIEDEFPGELDQWYQDTCFCPMGGESILSVQHRIKEFTEQYLDTKTQQLLQGVLVVSHALTSKMLILELMGMPMDYIRRIRQDNTGLNILKLSPKYNSIFLMNDTCHIGREQ